MGWAAFSALAVAHPDLLFEAAHVAFTLVPFYKDQSASLGVCLLRSDVTDSNASKIRSISEVVNPV